MGQKGYYFSIQTHHTVFARNHVLFFVERAVCQWISIKHLVQNLPVGLSQAAGFISDIAEDTQNLRFDDPFILNIDTITINPEQFVPRESMKPFGKMPGNLRVMEMHPVVGVYFIKCRINLIPPFFTMEFPYGIT